MAFTDFRLSSSDFRLSSSTKLDLDDLDGENSQRIFPDLGTSNDRKEKITSLDSTRLYSRYIDFPLEFKTDFRPTFLLSFSFLRDYNNTCVVKILDQMSINIVF